jgi:hypothetical protein
MQLPTKSKVSCHTTTSSYSLLTMMARLRNRLCSDETDTRTGSEVEGVQRWSQLLLRLAVELEKGMSELEPITDTPNSFDILGLRGVKLDFLPYFSDVHGNCGNLTVDILTPDSIKNHLFAKDPVRISCQ